MSLKFLPMPALSENHYGNRKTWARIPAQSKASFFPQKDFKFFKIYSLMKIWFLSSFYLNGIKVLRKVSLLINKENYRSRHWKTEIQSGLVYRDARSFPLPPLLISHATRQPIAMTQRWPRLTRRTNQTPPLKTAPLGGSPYRVPINESRLYLNTGRFSKKSENIRAVS